MLSPRVYNAWRPRPRVTALEWVPRYVRNEAGEPFSLADYPHAAGVLEAFDDPRRRELVLCWATRLGKTTLGYSLALFTAATRGLRMLYATSIEQIARTSVRDEFYPMAERCPRLREELPEERLRTTDRVEFADCHVRVGWSGSPSTLGGFSAWYVHCSEIDKWSTRASREADPLDLAHERAKQYPDHKLLCESTPTVHGGGRIWQRLLAGTNCRRHCPCPKCGVYAPLTFGTRDGAAGVIWDKLPDGTSDPDLALRTARYRCGACGHESGDEARPELLRRGVWVPEGQHCDPKGRLLGTPRRDGSIASFQLSSLYSLQVAGWGVPAEKFLRARRPVEIQNFVNSWLAEEYELTRAETDEEDLAARLGSDLPRGVVPLGASLVTLGCDVQLDCLKWLAVAWGAGATAWLIDWGVCDSWDELAAIVARAWPHADGGAALPAALTLVDSGYRTAEVYEFCRARSRPGQAVLACKGSGASDLKGQPYQKAALSEQSSAARRVAHARLAGVLVHVNTNYWQEVIQSRLTSGQAGDAGGLTLVQDAARDLPLLAELLNEGPVQEVDDRGYAKQVWRKRETDAPNDWRDALRYAYCAAEAKVRGHWARLPPRLPAGVPPPRAEPPRTRLTLPDGRPFFLTER